MTFTLLALLLFMGAIGVILPLLHIIKIRLSPKFASLTERTRYMLAIVVVLSLVYELSFLIVYLTDHLYQFPGPWADLYWVSAGLGGIIVGLLGINSLSRLIWLLSVLQIIIGFGLLGLLVLALGITSM